MKRLSSSRINFKKQYLLRSPSLRLGAQRPKVPFESGRLNDPLSGLQRLVPRTGYEKPESCLLLLFKLGHLNIRSPTAKIFADAWYLIFSSYVYEDDAFQIATAKSLECDLFLSADAELIEVAKQTNLQAANIETEAEKILNRPPKGRER